MLKKFGNSSRTREPDERASPSCELLADVSQRNLLSPPHNLFDHPNITSLDLRHNRLGLGCDPAAPKGWIDLTTFTRLTRLNLSNNHLRGLPPEIAQLTSLIVLNVVGNKLTVFPPEIGNLTRLQRLHADFNALDSLPKEISGLKYLTHLSLGYNRLATIPTVLSELESLQSLVLKGNSLGKLDVQLLARFNDLRSLNVRCCTLSGDVHVAGLRVLEVLNMSCNKLSSLTVTENPRLNTLDCSSCSLRSLELHEESLKIIIARHNSLDSITFLCQPTMLETLNISHNNFTKWPIRSQESPNLFTVTASHNQIEDIPPSVFQHGRLDTINLGYNMIKFLPDMKFSSALKKIFLQHNYLEDLQANLFSVLQKLEVLNLSFNKLKKLPILERSLVCECMKELNLSSNELPSDVCPAIASTFPKLEKLFLGYNHIECFQESILESFYRIKELSLAGNRLTKLPGKWSYLRQLNTFRLHSNFLHKLPSFSECPNLEVLDLSNNRIQKLPLPPLSSPSLRWLDISGNPHLYVDPDEFKGLCTEKTVAFVDACCLGRRNPPFNRNCTEVDTCCPWRIGLTERDGTRTRVIVDQKPLSSQLILALTEIGPSGYSAILPPAILTNIVENARRDSTEAGQYLRTAAVAIMEYLRSRGATLDTSLVLCHLIPVDGQMRMHVAMHGRGLCMMMNGKQTVYTIEEGAEDGKASDGDWESATQAGFFSDTSRPYLPAKYYPELEPELRIHDIPIDTDNCTIILGSSVLLDNLPAAHLVRELTRRMCSASSSSKRLLEAVLPDAGDQDVSVCVVRLSPSTCDSPFHRSPVEQRHSCRTEDNDSLQSLGFDDVETYKSWEYMLEQNHKLIFSRELETLSRSAVKGVAPRPNVVDINKNLNQMFGEVAQYASVGQYSPILTPSSLSNYSGSQYSYKAKAF